MSLPAPPRRSRNRSHGHSPCTDCADHALPQTPLEAIRRYEHVNRIPYAQRLDLQPGEATQ